jgi:hypothetical protein
VFRFQMVMVKAVADGREGGIEIRERRERGLC